MIHVSGSVAAKHTSPVALRGGVPPLRVGHWQDVHRMDSESITGKIHVHSVPPLRVHHSGWQDSNASEGAHRQSSLTPCQLSLTLSVIN